MRNRRLAWQLPIDEGAARRPGAPAEEGTARDPSLLPGGALAFERSAHLVVAPIDGDMVPVMEPVWDM